MQQLHQLPPNPTPPITPSSTISSASPLPITEQHQKLIQENSINSNNKYADLSDKNEHAIYQQQNIHVKIAANKANNEHINNNTSSNGANRLEKSTKSKSFCKKDDEIRLSIPIRDGIILEQFKLEHNLSVHNIPFKLKETVFQTLMIRDDIELQFKAFAQNDQLMKSDWPQGLKIAINNQQLSLEINDNNHKPLYLKSFINNSINNIEIHVSQCCCVCLFCFSI